MVRFAAGAPDAVLDAAFGGSIGGIVMEASYQGNVILARSLAMRGAIYVAGGTLTTPSNTLSATALDIEAPGIVRMGANGKLALTGDGTPLTGSGTLDTMTYRPNSVEYTGRATTDLAAATPNHALSSAAPARPLSAAVFAKVAA